MIEETLPTRKLSSPSRITLRRSTRKRLFAACWEWFPQILVGMHAVVLPMLERFLARIAIEERKGAAEPNWRKSWLLHCSLKGGRAQITI